MGKNLENKEIFSKNLTYYMDKNDVSRNDLCEKLDLKYMTLSDWINAKSYPRIDKIELLADFFGIQKSDLIEDKLPQQSKLNEDEEKLLTNFNNSNTEGKKIILNTSETISKAYPRALENNIITREEMLEYFKGKSFAAFSGVGLNQMSDENLRNIYDLVKNAEE